MKKVLGTTVAVILAPIWFLIMIFYMVMVAPIVELIVDLHGAIWEEY